MLVNSLKFCIKFKTCGRGAVADQKAKTPKPCKSEVFEFFTVPGVAFEIVKMSEFD